MWIIYIMFCCVHTPEDDHLRNYIRTMQSEVSGPCITNVFATRRKNFSQWHRSFQRKLLSHWLKFLRHVAITLVIQGPGFTTNLCCLPSMNHFPQCIGILLMTKTHAEGTQSMFCVISCVLCYLYRLLTMPGEKIVKSIFHTLNALHGQGFSTWVTKAYWLKFMISIWMRLTAKQFKSLCSERTKYVFVEN